MPGTEIHGHHYAHGEDLAELVEKLGSDSKYKDRLSSAHEDAQSGGTGVFEVGGHHYQVHIHSDGSRELKVHHY